MTPAIVIAAVIVAIITAMTIAREYALLTEEVVGRSRLPKQEPSKEGSQYSG